MRIAARTVLAASLVLPPLIAGAQHSGGWQPSKPPTEGNATKPAPPGYGGLEAPTKPMKPPRDLQAKTLPNPPPPCRPPCNTTPPEPKPPKTK